MYRCIVYRSSGTPPLGCTQGTHIHSAKCLLRYAYVGPRALVPDVGNTTIPKLTVNIWVVESFNTWLVYLLLLHQQNDGMNHGGISPSPCGRFAFWNIVTKHQQQRFLKWGIIGKIINTLGVTQKTAVIANLWLHKSFAWLQGKKILDCPHFEFMVF